MSIRRSLGWTLASQIALFLFQFGGQVALSRLLTPYEVGISVVAFSIAGIIDILQTAGLRNFIIREHDPTPQLVATTFSVNCILAVCTSGCVLAGSLLGSIAYHENGVGKVLCLIALLPIIGIFELRPSAMLQRQMSFKIIAGAGLLKAAISFAVTVGLALWGWSYMSIGYGAVCGALAGTALTSWFGRQHVGLKISFKQWRPVTKFALQTLAINGANNVSSRAIDLIVGQMLGLGTLALFSRASALNNLLWTNIHTVFTRIAFAAFAEEWRLRGELREIYLRTADLVTALLWPAFAGLAVIAGPVIHTLYGQKWLGATPLLQCFAAAAIILSSLTMTWEVFVVCGRTGDQARFEFVRSSLAVLFTYLGCLVSTPAAAAARVADALVALFIYRRPLSRMTGTEFKDLLPIYIRNGSFAVLAVLPATTIMATHGWRPDTPLPLVLAGVVAGVVVWLAVAQRADHVVVREIVHIFRKVRAQGI